jgi:hypothetical protein
VSLKIWLVHHKNHKNHEKKAESLPFIRGNVLAAFKKHFID